MRTFKQIRRASNISQKQIGEHVGKSQSWVSIHERAGEFDDDMYKDIWFDVLVTVANKDGQGIQLDLED